MDPTSGEEQTFYCHCDTCKGQIDYNYQDMLNPENTSISRFCAETEYLNHYYWKTKDCRTNAEYDLSLFGPEEFFVRNYNANLDPVDLFKEMEIFKP